MDTADGHRELWEKLRRQLEHRASRALCIYAGLSIAAALLAYQSRRDLLDRSRFLEAFVGEQQGSGSRWRDV
jgi:hypothetical protein